MKALTIELPHQREAILYIPPDYTVEDIDSIKLHVSLWSDLRSKRPKPAERPEVKAPDTAVAPVIPKAVDIGIPGKELMTTQEAAAFLGVSVSAIKNARLDGRLPTVVKYGRKLIPRADLEAYKARTQPEGEKLVGSPPKATA